jgi:hypothetical protein
MNRRERDWWRDLYNRLAPQNRERLESLHGRPVVVESVDEATDPFGELPSVRLSVTEKAMIWVPHLADIDDDEVSPSTD